MRRLLVAVTLVAAAGCASRSPSAGERTTGTVVVTAPPRVVGNTGNIATGAELVLGSEATLFRTPIPAPPARAYERLLQVWQQLGLEAAQTDPERFVVRNPRLTATRRLANQPMATLFDCGRSGLGQPLAATYRMRIDIQTALVPAGTGSGSELQTLVRANAQNMGGTSNDPVVCRSTEVLEKHIANAVLVGLGQ